MENSQGKDDSGSERTVPFTIDKEIDKKMDEGKEIKLGLRNDGDWPSPSAEENSAVLT